MEMFPEYKQHAASIEQKERNKGQLLLTVASIADTGTLSGIRIHRTICWNYILSAIHQLTAVTLKVL